MEKNALRPDGEMLFGSSVFTPVNGRSGSLSVAGMQKCE